MKNQSHSSSTSTLVGFMYTVAGHPNNSKLTSKTCTLLPSQKNPVRSIPIRTNACKSSMKNATGLRMMSDATGSGSSGKYIVLCPGQGAQAIGMALSWMDKSAAAKKVFELADEEMKQGLGGEKLSEIIRNGPKERLDKTDIAQPAIFTASVACWEGMKETGVVPKNAGIVAAGGLSLGEYTALVVGGRMSFKDGLKLVALRGKAMQDAADASNGTMAALLGADEEMTNEIVLNGLELAGKKPGDVLVAANFNSPGQVVISGSRAPVEKAAKYAEEQKKLKVVLLDVAGAFHSPLMAPAAARLKEALESTPIQPATCPVMSNVSAHPHENDADSVRTRLVEQLTNPVRWENCVKYMIKNAPADATWVELAPGKTLMGMMRKIDRNVKVQNFE